MVNNSHHICVFKFQNQSRIRVAVPSVDDEGDVRSFEQMLQLAKDMSWCGDEQIGRGPLLSFKVGAYVVVWTT